MRHTRDTHTTHTRERTCRRARDAHTLSVHRCYTNMVNNKREIYNKLPASRAGRKRHFRRYPPPPPAVVILPRTLGRAAAWGRGWWQLKRRRGCSRSQPRCACPCPWRLPPWPAPCWGRGPGRGLRLSGPGHGPEEGVRARACSGAKLGSPGTTDLGL